MNRSVYNKAYKRTVNMSAIPTCNILGVNIAAIDMQWLLDCYPAFYLVLNHATFKQIKKRHNINYSDGFYIGLLYAVPLVLS